MKKIVAAWIEQILEFDGKLEYMAYMEGLKQKGQRFKEISFDQLESGNSTITMRSLMNKRKGDLNEVQRKVEKGYAAVRS